MSSFWPGLFLQVGTGTAKKMSGFELFFQSPLLTPAWFSTTYVAFSFFFFFFFHFLWYNGNAEQLLANLTFCLSCSQPQFMSAPYGLNSWLFPFQAPKFSAFNYFYSILLTSRFSTCDSLFVFNGQCQSLWLEEGHDGFHSMGTIIETSRKNTEKTPTKQNPEL